MAWLGRQRRLVVTFVIVFIAGIALGVGIASLGSGGDPGTSTSTVVNLGSSAPGR
jgi:hypothetical protein